MRGLGLGLGFTNPGGTRGVLTCVCVRILCVDGRSMYLYIVLDGYLRILCAPSVQSRCTLSISASHCPKNREIGPPLLGSGGFDTICTDVCLRRNRFMLVGHANTIFTNITQPLHHNKQHSTTQITGHTLTKNPTLQTMH